MKSKSNLFMVRSPLQALSAYEFIKQKKTINNIIVVILNDTLKNSEQLINILELFDIWDKVIVIKSVKSKFISYIKLIFNLQKNEYENILISKFSNIEKVALANLKYEQSYLIDDGTATINEYKKILKYYNNRRDEEKIKFRDFRFNLFGLKTKVVKHINFFTIFDLPSGLNFEIVKNNFISLKQFFNITNKSLTDKIIYIAGQHLSQERIITQELYEKTLEKIFLEYKGFKIIYIPHRSENTSEYKEVFERNNISILELTLPIELYFLKNEIYPYKIISFFSTCLFTLNILYPDTKIEAILFAKNEINDYNDDILCTYEYLKKEEGIKCLNYYLQI